jgi:hypothetical protein
MTDQVQLAEASRTALDFLENRDPDDKSTHLPGGLKHLFIPTKLLEAAIFSFLDSGQICEAIEIIAFAEFELADFRPSILEAILNIPNFHPSDQIEGVLKEIQGHYQILLDKLYEPEPEE